MNRRPLTLLLALCLGAGAVGASRLAAQEPLAPQEIQATPPPFTDGIFPCTSCHDGKTVKLNTQRRALSEMHDDIQLKHGPDSRWCLDCHDPENRDQLRLASGERIDFTSSYLLCGQCHGDKYRDWRVGVHGKRTGSWNGAKQYYLCVHCHNPHSPHFKPLKPMPAPVRPDQLRAGKGGGR
ncbi:MAG TPA: cytochrome c3 family protein [Holophagaceae bacterium]|nr:cytochrome c3 family protein [Holophagaceae bacterium]